MTKTTKIYFIILGLFFGVALVYGMICMKSVHGEKNPNKMLEKKSDILLSLEEDMYNPYFINTSACTLQALEDAADMIAIVSVGDNREMKMYSTKSQVKIEKILQQKSSAFFEGEKIWIEEPATISVGRSFSTDGYQLMKIGQKYLLFLKHLPCIDGYQYSKVEQTAFTLVSEYYGKFCITEQEKIEVLQNEAEEELFYYNVNNYALFTEEQDKVDTYKKLYKEVTDIGNCETNI